MYIAWIHMSRGCFCVPTLCHLGHNGATLLLHHVQKYICNNSKKKNTFCLQFLSDISKIAYQFTQKYVTYILFKVNFNRMTCNGAAKTFISIMHVAFNYFRMTAIVYQLLVVISLKDKYMKLTFTLWK